MKVNRVSDNSYTLHFDDKEMEFIRSLSELLEVSVKEIVDKIVGMGFFVCLKLFQGRKGTYGL